MVIKVSVKWSKTMRVFLELIRIIFIFLIFGCLMWGGVKLIYSTLRIDVDSITGGGWSPGIAIYIYCLSYIVINYNLQDFMKAQIKKSCRIK